MRKKENSKPKSNRPNFLWIYAIIGLIFLGIWVITGQFAPQPEKINRNEVKVMLENQWVHRIVTVNDRNVEVSVKTKEEIDSLSVLHLSQRDTLKAALSDSLKYVKERLVNMDNKTPDLLQKEEDLESKIDSLDGLSPILNGNEVYELLEIKKDVALMGGSNRGPHFTFTISSQDEFEKEVKSWQRDFPAENQVSVESEVRESFFSRYGWLLFVGMMAVWFFLMRRMAGGGMGGGGQIFNVGKSKAQLFDKDTAVKTTFDSVAGLEGAKEEVVEIVSFLKRPPKIYVVGRQNPQRCLIGWGAGHG